MLKKSIALIFAIYLVLACTVFSYAATDVSVLINGVKIEYDVPARIIDDRTMVPMRKTFDMLGAKVDWNAEMRVALATYKTSIIAIGIGCDTFSVVDVISGVTEEYKLDVPAQIVDGRTLIPLRAVSQALGKKVEWDGSTSTVLIND
ncbi:MAG: copper amine oxidase N-terminal domain-containing protein [Clostridia bacterium]|nr:copper amine oxidase N-terminal domain-containing protein [Clostridia bacterium]